MEVNNFDRIEKVLCSKLDSDVTTVTDKVLLGRIIRRRKENPDDPRGEYIVKRYSFATKEKFVEAQEEIKNLCRMFNARFYLNVNIKSMKEIAFDIAEIIPGLLRKEQYYFVRRIFDNTADANKGLRDHRMWIFDIDNKEHLGPVVKYLVDMGTADKLVDIIPTINGAHILIEPHDVRYMTKAEVKVGEDAFILKDIVDVKKNAMTLVYYDSQEDYISIRQLY